MADSAVACDSLVMRYLSKFQLATLFMAALYIISPVDTIPEIVTGPFGLVDDAAAFAVIITILAGARAKAAAGGSQPTYVRVDPDGRVI